MKTHKVLRNFNSNNFTEPEIAAKADHIVGKMQNDPRFPNPNPSLEAITIANVAYKSALVNAMNGSKYDTTFKNECKQQLVTLLNQLTFYVQVVSKGDLEIILSSGFDANKEPAHIGPLPKATNLIVKPSNTPGSVELSCNPIKKVRTYIFAYTEAPATNESVWHQKLSTRRKTQIDGLTSGKQYVFKAAGTGSDPSINWSDKISSYVL